MTDRPKSSHHTGFHLYLRNPHPAKEHHGDCATRAACLLLDRPYGLIWAEVTEVKQWARGNRATADSGTSINELKRSLERITGLSWVYKSLSSGTDFHKDNLPERCIAVQANHFVCVKDGAVWDSFDSRGKRRKQLRGYLKVRDSYTG